MHTHRAYFSSTITRFLSSSVDTVLGEMARTSGFAIELTQRDAWVRQIGILQAQLQPWRDNGHVFFEFVVPRMGRRIDVLVLIQHCLLVI